MAFIPYSYDDGQPRPWEYIPCDDIAVSVGMALYQDTGLLKKATGATKPAYISMINKTVAAEGDLIPVIRVDHGIVFETSNSASFSGAKVGTKVTLHTDALQVTATTTSGVAEIIDFDDVAAAGTGGTVHVRF